MSDKPVDKMFGYDSYPSCDECGDELSKKEYDKSVSIYQLICDTCLKERNE